jgi:hypothetical protein
LLKVATLDTGRKLKTFKEWLARRHDGFLLPDRPSLKRMLRIKTTPFTDTQQKRLHPKKVKPPKLLKPTVRAVKEIVPNKLIPKLKPMKPRSPLSTSPVLSGSGPTR